jgi:hypothetical protein
MQIFNELHLNTPYWEGRNKMIAEEFLEPDKSVLDLGCGSKILLRYYSPSRYLGVDGFDSADLNLDLNQDFVLPSGWDYAVNSGILEYLDNVENYLVKIKGLANEYIFTWWTGRGYGRMSHDRFESVISKNYVILKSKHWGPVQKIYKCTEL